MLIRWRILRESYLDKIFTDFLDKIFNTPFIFFFSIDFVVYNKYIYNYYIVYTLLLLLNNSSAIDFLMTQAQLLAGFGWYRLVSGWLRSVLGGLLFKQLRLPTIFFLLNVFVYFSELSSCSD